MGGEGSWFDIALDVIAVASFGLGRAAVGAIKDSALLARAVGRAQKFTSIVKDVMSGDRYLRGGESALDEMLPEAWKATSEEFEVLDDSEVRAAQAHAPGAWPKWGGIGRGFNPVSILRDGFKDIGDLKLSNWKALVAGKARGEAWKGAKFFFADPEIHEAVESLDKIEKVADAVPVKAYTMKVASNHNMWRAITAPAVALDITNHVITEEPMPRR